MVAALRWQVGEPQSRRDTELIAALRLQVGKFGRMSCGALVVDKAN